MTQTADDWWSEITAWKHKDDVPWHQAPIPPVDHECFVQTQGWIGFDQWARCACGGVADGISLRSWRDVHRWKERGRCYRPGFSAVDVGIWAERNTRGPAAATDAASPVPPAKDPTVGALRRLRDRILGRS